MAHTNPNEAYNDMPDLPPKAGIKTDRIWKACVAANKSLARMREAGKHIPNQEILFSSLPLMEATRSSQIGNIFTTTDALYKAMSVPEKETDPATKEVLRYREALKVGIDELKSGKKLGEILLTRVCSVLRDKETDRRNAGAGTHIKDQEGQRVYTPPDDPIILENRIHRLEDYMNDENDGREPDVLIRMALIHYQFEAIHPFEDGNGRTGRILNILYLIDQGLLDIPILYLSRYIIHYKSEYYKRLQRVTENGEWEEWIIFMLNAVRETADMTYDWIRAISSLLDKTMTICKEKLPKIYSRDLIEEIFLQPYCKPAFLVARRIGNRQTAMKYLKALEDVGILVSVRIGKERIYKNWRLYELLEERTDVVEAYNARVKNVEYISQIYMKITFEITKHLATTRRVFDKHDEESFGHPVAYVGTYKIDPFTPPLWDDGHSFQLKVKQNSGIFNQLVSAMLDRREVVQDEIDAKIFIGRKCEISVRRYYTIGHECEISARRILTRSNSSA